MTVTLTPWIDADDAAVRALLAEPAIAEQNDMLLGPGRLAHWFADPFCDPAIRFVARVDGEPAGFAFGFVLHAGSPPWAMLRPNVAPKFRRSRVGTRLLEAQLDALARVMPQCAETCLAAYEPCDDGHAFAAHHGFRVVRHYWMMERPGATAPEIAWPAGVTMRTFAHRDADVRDWTDAYNASFARHYHFVPATLEEGHALVAMPDFDGGSLALAYDAAGRCVGFCRDELHAGRGEVAALGVAPAMQGRGLGRALLRWGVHRLIELGAPRVTLLVDGENDNALGLYRSEGFAVVKTRPVWSRAPRRPKDAP